jgi:hypothetical protein
MADEHNLAVLGVDDPPRRLDVAIKCDGGILNYCDLIAVGAKDAVNSFPARAIHEAPVNEDDGNWL